MQSRINQIKLSKLDELLHWFEGKNRVLIALSGGVDSALVAYAAFRVLKNSALAVTADYKTLSQDELNSARQICSEIGIKQLVINYDELENENFVENDKNRCFFCRSELSVHLNEIANKNNIDLIVDGTNLDDLGDYRPGIQALHEGGIQSPLVETEFNKKQIRDAAKHVGLSVYDKPANSCLASRIPWGQRVTLERLTRIELGENIIKQIIPVKLVRVRDINGVAKIELDNTDLNLLYDKTKLDEIIAKLKMIGFGSVIIDPEGYKSGKINVIAD